MEEVKLVVDDCDQSNKNSKRKNALIAIVVVCSLMIVIGLVIGFCAPGGATSSNYLTYQNYSRIQNGMSYSQVVDVLGGHQGVLDVSSSYGGYTLSYYTWSNQSGTRCIVVGFENNKVCAKSQYGLS